MPVDVGIVACAALTSSFLRRLQGVGLRVLHCAAVHHVRGKVRSGLLRSVA